MNGRLFSLLAFLAVLVAPAAALADPKADPKDAKAQADHLMDEHRYAEAYAIYARAYESSHDPALLYNQGRALEAMGEYPDAYDRLEQFEREAPPALRAKVPGLHEFIVDLGKRIATVVLRTNVKGAQVQIRQKTVPGEAGMERIVRTRAGPATIDVTAEGWLPFHLELDLPGGDKTVVTAALVAKKRDALLLVRTRPVADVTLDGKPMGPSPLEVHVAAGSHALIAEASGYDEQRVSLQVALGDRRDIDLELEKRPGVVARWWFWTAIGVVVVAGVTTAVLLTTERHPDHGSFDTGTVRGP